MDLGKYHLHLHIGQRNIKTALAATLCALTYFIFGRNPTFACIGAIFGLGSDMASSRLNGGNRFFGTLIGGVLGMGLFRLYIIFYPEGGIHFPLLLFLFIGVVILIVVSQVCHWPGAIQPGGVVLCILLFNTPVETYLSYSIARILDTGIGVLFALLVNFLLPREKVIRFLEKLHMKHCAPLEKHL
ncbi:MAG: FUSC family protein [Clostridia bacterium]|nr:FUSC family protein [Clostridia bacterium]